MKLEGEELEKVRDALFDAFPSPGQMRLLVHDAGIDTSFDDVAFNASTYEEGIHNLLIWTVGQYRLTKLLKAAVKKAPDNPELKEIAAFVERYFVFLPRFLPGTDEGERKTALGEAELVLFKESGFEGVKAWLEKLDRFQRWVCRIEPQPWTAPEANRGYGTGFLIAPDVVITNDHVASGYETVPGFWNDPARARNVVCRFDCNAPLWSAADGTPRALAADYPILRSPLDELDFALLKLAPLKEPVAGDAGPAGKRGYATPVGHNFKSSEPLLILQHPMGDPLKLAFGSVTPAADWPADRIAYKVNTAAGSSGSPCATQKLEIAALHHWGAGAQNSGVLFSAILAFLRKPEHAEKLKAAGLGHLLGGAEVIAGSGATEVPKNEPVAQVGGGVTGSLPPPRPVTDLTGPQKQELRAAVLGAFSLDELIECLALRMNLAVRNVIPMGGGNLTVVFNLLVWLGQEGRLDEYLSAIAAEKPNNAKLQKVVSAIRAAQAPV